MHRLDNFWPVDASLTIVEVLVALELVLGEIEAEPLLELEMADVGLGVGVGLGVVTGVPGKEVISEILVTMAVEVLVLWASVQETATARMKKSLTMFIMQLERFPGGPTIRDLLCKFLKMENHARLY